MLKLLSTLALALFVFTSNAHAERLNFEFYDAGGDKKYKSKNFSKEIKSKKKMNILLIETNTLDGNAFKTQIKLFKRFNFEEQALALVVACPDKKYEDGYHTSTSQAKKLRGNYEKELRVRLLNHKAEIKGTSSIPMGQSMIRRWLSK